MAGQQKPWEKYGGAQGPVMLGTPSAKSAYEGPTAAADLAAKRQEAILRDLAIQAAQQKLKAGGGELPPPPGDPNKTGDEYIASLPRGMAPTVKSMIEGRQAPPSSFALSKPYWQQMMSAANQADPSFDQSQWASRVVTRKAYESQARSSPSQVITSLNTLAAHANNMYANHLQMAGPNLGPLSDMAASAMQSFDKKYTPAYNTEVGFVQGELQKLVNNGAATQAEAERIISNLKGAQSSEARASAIKAVVGLAEGKIAPIRQGWSAVFGDRPMPSDVTPSSMAVFDNILADGKQALPTDRYGTPIAPGATPGAPGVGGPPTVGPRGGGSSPPGFQGGPSATKTPQFYDPNGSGPGGMSLAQGGTHSEYDPQVSAQVDGMIRKGYSADRINAALASIHATPVDAGQVQAAQAYLRLHPDFKGSFGSATKSVPDSSPRLNSFQQSPFGVYLDAVSNAGTLNNKANIVGLIGGNADLQRGGMEQAAAQHPVAATLGNLTGGTAAALGTETGFAAAGRALGAGAKALPWIRRAADAAYGGASAASANPDDPWAGVKGAAAGLGGGMFGRQIVAPVAGALGRQVAGSRLGQAVGGAYRDIRGLPAAAPMPQPLAGADKTLLTTAQKGGIPGILDQLNEAQRLGVPMSLADTHPALTSLAGAAVRRSPTAEEVAQQALLPRSRGQIDRFGQAVETNLGPVGNIPQISADMTQRARVAAGPLYDRAYSQPVTSTPELDATLGTPFGRDALGRARTIAANERRSPTELGFAQDAQGNTVLNPMPNQAIANHLAARSELDAAQAAYKAAKGGSGNMDAARARVEQARGAVRDAETALGQAPDPSMPASVPGYTTQTLDYVKRGMDDVLEQQRNPITGRLQLDEAGRAQNQVKNQFLGEVDRLNPAYRDARQAYAGPVQARDAMARGQDAFSLDPNTLAMQVSNQTPEHLAQMQLGYRDSLMGAANRVRYSSNPFDATLGTPVAAQRLSVLHPENAQGVGNLLAQRDMEAGLGRSTNDILGNSKTAQRLLADQNFQGSNWAQTGLDLGVNLATGQVPVGTVIKGVGKLGLNDMMKFGIGRRAVAKADALAPMLLNTDPAASADSLTALMNSSKAYRDFVDAYNRRFGRPAGMFGAAAGAALVPGQ